MTGPDAKRKCTQCGEWTSSTFDTKVDTERIVFADTPIVPDPKEMVSQHVTQTAKTGLCMKCVVKELETMKEAPDNGLVRVSWPSNGGINT